MLGNELVHRLLPGRKSLIIWLLPYGRQETVISDKRKVEIFLNRIVISLLLWGRNPGQLAASKKDSGQIGLLIKLAELFGIGCIYDHFYRVFSRQKLCSKYTEKSILFLLVQHLKLKSGYFVVHCYFNLPNSNSTVSVTDSFYDSCFCPISSRLFVPLSYFSLL